MLINWPARNWKLKEDFYPEVPVEATACETQPKKTCVILTYMFFLKKMQEIHGQFTACWPQVSPKALQFPAEDEEPGYDGLAAASADQWWDGYGAESADQWWDGFLPKKWLHDHWSLVDSWLFGWTWTILIPSYLYVVQSSSQATRMNNGSGFLLQWLVNLHQPFAQVSWPNLRRYLHLNTNSKHQYPDLRVQEFIFGTVLRY